MVDFQVTLLRSLYILPSYFINLLERCRHSMLSNRSVIRKFFVEMIHSLVSLHPRYGGDSISKLFERASILNKVSSDKRNAFGSVVLIVQLLN